MSDLLASPQSIVSISRETASIGIIALLKYRFDSSFINSKFEIQIGRNSLGIISSQSNFL